MIKQRIARLVGALLLVSFGVEGLFSPLAHLALMRSMPDCVEAGPMGAAVGMELRLLSAVPDCPHGSFAPATSYHVIAQAALSVLYLDYVHVRGRAVGGDYGVPYDHQTHLAQRHRTKG